MKRLRPRRDSDASSAAAAAPTQSSCPSNLTPAALAPTRTPAALAPAALTPAAPTHSSDGGAPTDLMVCTGCSERCTRAQGEGRGSKEWPLCGRRGHSGLICGGLLVLDDGRPRRNPDSGGPARQDLGARSSPVGLSFQRKPDDAVKVFVRSNGWPIQWGAAVKMGLVPEGGSGGPPALGQTVCGSPETPRAPCRR